MTMIVRKITIPLLVEMREKFRLLDDGLSHEARAKALAPDYPDFSLRTLEDYSRVVKNSSEKTWAAFVDAKISLQMIQELGGVESRELQDYLLGEVLANPKLTRSRVGAVKKMVAEGMSVPEALARATGELPPERPPTPKHKNFDTILDDIARTGAKFRSLVALAGDLLKEAEVEAGVHPALFEEVYRLRHYVGEQYDFLNQKLNRHLVILKKRVNGTKEPIAHEPSPDAPVERS